MTFYNDDGYDFTFITDVGRLSINPTFQNETIKYRSGDKECALFLPQKSGTIALLDDSPFDVFTISTVSVSGSITWVCWEDPAKQEYIWRKSSSSINFEVKDTNNNQIQVSKWDSYFSIKGKFLAIYSNSTITPSTAHSYSTTIGKSTSSTTFYTGANNIINSFQFNLNTSSDSFWTPSSDPSVANVGETAMVEVDTTFQFSHITFIKLKE